MGTQRRVDSSEFLSLTLKNRKVTVWTMAAVSQVLAVHLHEVGELAWVVLAGDLEKNEKKSV